MSDQEAAGVLAQSLADPLPKPRAAHAIQGALSWMPAGPVSREFIQHPARVSAEMGPYGSGKTTALFIKKLLCSMIVPPSPMDGVRYARTAIIRDTYRNLELNTIPSWEERFPRAMGEWRGGGNGEPARARLRFKLQDNTELDWEVIFAALGDHNVKEFCDGLQLTNAGADGIDALPPELFRVHLPFRLARWPHPGHRVLDPEHPHFWKRFTPFACKLSGVFNAPDEDNWTYKDFIDKPRKGWKLFVQPGGMDAGAENLDNLEDGYYEAKIESLDEWDANRFVHNKFGYSRSGMPIYPEFNEKIHVPQVEIKFDPGRTLHAGVDGGRDCCAVFGQENIFGGIDILAELVPEKRQGAKQFGKTFAKFISDEFPDAREIEIHPDPATANPNDLDDENVWLDLFLEAAEFERSDTQIPVTNAFSARREAVARKLTELEEGRPMYRLNARCRVLRRGFMSGYKFEVKEKSDGETKAALEPADTKFTHPHDANQYLVLNVSGLGKVIVARSKRKKEKPETSVGWDPHDY